MTIVCVLLVFVKKKNCFYSATELIFGARDDFSKHASVLDDRDVLLLRAEFTLFVKEDHA